MSFSRATVAPGGDCKLMKSLNSSVVVAALALSILAQPGVASAASPFKKVSGGTLHVPSGVIFAARIGAFQFASTGKVPDPPAGLVGVAQ